jgi:RNA polymerase II subunit A small phosphatase-like protein
MNGASRKLLVLDIDETLVHARESPLAHDEDFCVGAYFVYRRPGLDEFVTSMLDTFDVAVWTSSGESYAAQVLERIFPPGALKFVWSSKRCTTRSIR